MLAAALSAPVADAMLLLWALAVEHSEQAFAKRSEEIEREARLTEVTASILTGKKLHEATGSAR
ncbi:hypothetical protein KQH49_10915 [Mycetohabitans sp. B5]|nr:hypothetical protein [Mycetohabitans sp. B5]